MRIPLHKNGRQAASGERGGAHSPAMKSVRLPAAYLRRICDHCRSELPLEACGLLFGAAEGPVVRIAEVQPARNAAEAPHRQFTVDPQAWVRAVCRTPRSGPPLIGVYHSHPRTPPVPSPEDLRTSWHSLGCYLIVSLADPHAPELRAYRLQDDAGVLRNEARSETHAAAPLGYTELAVAVFD